MKLHEKMPFALQNHRQTANRTQMGTAPHTLQWCQQSNLQNCHWLCCCQWPSGAPLGRCPPKLEAPAPETRSTPRQCPAVPQQESADPCLHSHATDIALYRGTSTSQPFRAATRHVWRDHAHLQQLTMRRSSQLQLADKLRTTCPTKRCSKRGRSNKTNLTSLSCTAQSMSPLPLTQDVQQHC